MIHPSYVELMKVVNDGVEIGEEPVVNSRYSIVLATAKRARQIIAGAEPMIENPKCNKPLSIAVEELYRGDGIRSPRVRVYQNESYPRD